MRTHKSIKNVGIMLLTQLITLVLAFVSRTVFIKTLGAEYLGLNGLFSNILNALSLAEMGIGTAIAYALYKPIAENDTEQIKSILAFYRKCYFSIGIFIIAIGCLIIPFLPYLIKGEVSVPVNIHNVYLCFLANSAITYFFAHKRTIIDETQNKYLTTSVDFIINTIISIIQIIILWQFKDYMLFLFAKILGTLVGSIIILIFANRKFPYIIEKAVVLSSSAKKKIWSNVSILFFHKFGGVVILGSDFLIISAFVGIEAVGIYSNYTLIVGTITVFCNLFVMGANASIGNAIATLSKKEVYVVFRRMAFLIFCTCGFSAVCLVNLLNPFVELWVGKDYLLSNAIVYVIVANFFFMQNRWLILAFRSDAGIFRPDMYKPLIEVVFNLSLSIFLVRIYGVLGVLIGTLANTFFVCIWVEMYIVHKYIFAISTAGYLKMYAVQTLALLISCVLAIYINNFIEPLVGKLVISILVTTIVYLLFFFRTEEFKYFGKLIFSFLSNKSKPYT
ncbi:MAG: oligosaccharide flippase family protein [Fibromonadaceae bacterium]|jgi:O-antigen/teichoic acid export membrane protein|nr:oligosaccharide flippase family protein [Fibromonadaceae bacterium]